ncbi:MAG TPA: hypothetical protein VIC84_20450 [Blastocatellia bacterium]
MIFSFSFDPFAGRKKNKSLAWKIVGGVALAAAAAGLIANFPDIRRYIKIERM